MSKVVPFRSQFDKTNDEMKEFACKAIDEGAEVFVIAYDPENDDAVVQMMTSIDINKTSQRVICQGMIEEAKRIVRSYAPEAVWDEDG